MTKAVQHEPAARLQITAPAMFDALKKIAATERRNMNPNNRLKLIYEIADAALAKAEGRND